jgi:hypothetical protein
MTTASRSRPRAPKPTAPDEHADRTHDGDGVGRDAGSHEHTGGPVEHRHAPPGVLGGPLAVNHHAHTSAPRTGLFVRPSLPPPESFVAAR